MYFLFYSTTLEYLNRHTLYCADVTAGVNFPAHTVFSVFSLSYLPATLRANTKSKHTQRKLLVLHYQVSLKYR